MINEAAATETRFVVFVHLTALPSWLRLPHERRAAVRADELLTAFATHPRIHTQWIDVESYSAASSDILIAHVTDLADWNLLFEKLRDTSFFSEPYFRVDQILVGIEDGYRAAETGAGAA